jgi:ABC-type Fe3+-siderophore transport system permease subunit
MERLRTPLIVNAVYVLLVGLVSLSTRVVQAVFGYQVMDRGVLLVFSGSELGLGIVLWGIASAPEKHGALWKYVVTGIAIGTVWLLIGWVRHFYNARNVLVPVIINVVLLIWIWSARPKT